MKDAIRLARELRHASTDAERLLWSRLRNRRLERAKFRRQVPMGSYIVDFACLELRVIIELDGGQHAEPDHQLQDAERDRWLREQGFCVLRFWNNDVLINLDAVLEAIREKILRDG